MINGLKALSKKDGTLLQSNKNDLHLETKRNTRTFFLFEMFNSDLILLYAGSQWKKKRLKFRINLLVFYENQPCRSAKNFLMTENHWLWLPLNIIATPNTQKFFWTKSSGGPESYCTLNFFIIMRQTVLNICRLICERDEANFAHEITTINVFPKKIHPRGS
jgi:hypothetical protein